MFDRSAVDGDDDDVDGSYKDTRHSALLSQSTANGHVSSVVPPLFLYHTAPPPPFYRESRASPHLPSNVCDLLQILRNLSSLYRILNLIICDDIINFKMLTATQRMEGRGRESGWEEGFWQPYKVQPELLFHINRARQAEE